MARRLKPIFFCESLGLHRVDDSHGPLAEVLRDERGYPVGVRYGETLVALYHFDPADLAELGETSVVPEWIELIDTRTGGAILDTRLFEDAPAMPWFIVLTGGLSTGNVLVRAEMGGPLHMEVSAGDGIYALMPIDAGEIWRSAEVYTDGLSFQDAYRARLDYTEIWMRLHLGFPEDGRVVVVEAPRNASSAAPARLLHPDLPLPAIESDASHESAMPASASPGPERFVIPSDWRAGLPVIRSPDYLDEPRAVVSGMGGGPATA